MLNDISFSGTSKKVYKHVVYLFLRRTLDIVLSLLFIVLFLPVGIIIYWLVKGKGEPVFIKRLHAGENGKSFTRVQFRTHANVSSVIRAFPPQSLSREWEHGVPDNVTFAKERIGVFIQTGRLLKKYHLYRLPELFHVLKGHMSIVGPRPELMEVAAYYNRHQRKRLLTKPGITGLAQLKGYTNKQHKKMVENDLSYIDQKSIYLDIKIIWHTLIRYPDQKHSQRSS